MSASSISEATLSYFEALVLVASSLAGSLQKVNWSLCLIGSEIYSLLKGLVAFKTNNRLAVEGSGTDIYGEIYLHVGVNDMGKES